MCRKEKSDSHLAFHFALLKSLTSLNGDLLRVLSNILAKPASIAVEFAWELIKSGF